MTFSAGYVQSFPWRRFIVYDVIACSLWATYAALLGYFGGKTFEDHPFWGLALAIVIALSLGPSSSSIRHVLARSAGGRRSRGELVARRGPCRLR